MSHTGIIFAGSLQGAHDALRPTVRTRTQTVLPGLSLLIVALPPLSCRQLAGKLDWLNQSSFQSALFNLIVSR